MQRLALSTQDGAEALEGTTASAEQDAEPGPMIDGPAPVLWAGAGVALVTFFLVITLIIKLFVRTPNKRKTKLAAPNYFEPAGDEADIRFDDEDGRPEGQQTSAPNEESSPSPSDDFLTETQDPRHAGDLLEIEEEDALTETTASVQEKKKTPFSGLFAKKDDEPSSADERQDQDMTERTDIDEPESDIRAMNGAPQQAAHTPPTAPPSYEEQRRIAEAEETAQRALQRADEAERLARDLARANANTERAIALGIEKQDAALDAMGQRLSLMAQEFQTRLDSAPQITASGMTDNEGGVSEAHFAEFANLIGEQFESLRSAVNGAIDRLSHRIDHLPTGTGDATITTASRIQLTDLLNDALPPQRYQLDRKLSSGRSADACINMPGGQPPIAIDARFPVEAFDAWRSAQTQSESEAAETELRRTVLRHIVDAAERLIVDGETADGAMMFVPSEQILCDLHARFPDLVQESYRAKVWIVAPTSLMATLHTLSAVATNLDQQHVNPSTAGDVAAALNAMQERLAALESGDNRPATQGPAPPATYEQTFQQENPSPKGPEKPTFQLR